MVRLREINQEQKKTYPRIKKCQHPKILKIKINKGKIIAFLDDNREVSIPVNWLTKENISEKELSKYELWGNYQVFFPVVKEILGVEIFTDGLKNPCCDYH